MIWRGQYSGSLKRIIPAPSFLRLLNPKWVILPNLRLNTSSVILAAAIKEGYEGPVFIQADHTRSMPRNSMRIPIRNYRHCRT